MPERGYHRFDEQHSLDKLAPASAAATSLDRKRKRPSRPESAGNDTVNGPVALHTHSQDDAVDRLVALHTHSRSQQAPLRINEFKSSRHAEPNLRARAADLERARKTLPIWAHASEISQALRARDVLLIVGETGSGKRYLPRPCLRHPCADFA